MNIKKKNESIRLALKKNLKKRKLIQKKKQRKKK